MDAATPDRFASFQTLSAESRQHEAHLFKKKFCFARRLGEKAPEVIVGRVALGGGGDAPVSEECYLATELLFARRDECPLEDVAEAPPLQHVAADAIRSTGDDKELYLKLFGNVLVAGSDDARLLGINVRIAQELSSLMKGRVTVRCADASRHPTPTTKTPRRD